MDTFFVLFGIVVLFAALLVPGYILGRARLIEEGAMLSFSNILMYVAMPFLVFSKLLEIDLARIEGEGLLLSAIMPIAVELPLLLLLRIGGKTNGRRRAAIFCSAFPNCGFLGIPLAAAIWPERPEIVLYISVFNVVSTFLLLTLGVFVLSGNKKDISIKKTLISPIFFAIILGAFASATGLASVCPAICAYSVTLAQLTTPVAMIALGYEFSKMNLLKMWRRAGIYTVALIKLVISPLIALVLLLAVTLLTGDAIEESLVFAILVATSVSTAASAPSMAKKYGADAEYAATLTLANTIICVISLPLMYLIYRWVF